MFRGNETFGDEEKTSFLERAVLTIIASPFLVKDAAHRMRLETKKLGGYLIGRKYEEKMPDKAHPRPYLVRKN